MKKISKIFTFALLLSIAFVSCKKDSVTPKSTVAATPVTNTLVKKLTPDQITDCIRRQQNDLKDRCNHLPTKHATVMLVSLVGNPTTLGAGNQFIASYQIVLGNDGVVIPSLTQVNIELRNNAANSTAIGFLSPIADPLTQGSTQINSTTDGNVETATVYTKGALSGSIQASTPGTTDLSSLWPNAVYPANCTVWINELDTAPINANVLVSGGAPITLTE